MAFSNEKTKQNLFKPERANEETEFLIFIVLRLLEEISLGKLFPFLKEKSSPVEQILKLLKR